MFPNLIEVPGGCQGASESWHVLNFSVSDCIKQHKHSVMLQLSYREPGKCYHTEYISYSKHKKAFWGTRAGGQWEQGHGGVHQDHGEHVQLYVWHHFQNASIQGCQISQKEDPEQVDSENKDMEESIRIMVNMFNYICCTIFKMPASRAHCQIFRFITKKNVQWILCWKSYTLDPCSGYLCEQPQIVD